jgi:hypothetical protein
VGYGESGVTIPKPITDAAQTILTRLDAMYAGIDPDDKAAAKAIWIELLTETDDEQEQAA